MKTLRSILVLSAVGFVVSTQLGSGCVSDGDRDRYPRDPEPYRNDPYRNDPYRNDPYGRREPNSYPEPYHGPRDYRWDTVPLPREAQLVAEGRDVLKFRARDVGRIYLYDSDERFVIDDRTIFSGEEYIVAPKDNRAWVDHDRVVEYDFPERHEYRLYFVPRHYEMRDRDSDRRRDADRDSVRQEAVRKRQPPANNSGSHGSRDYHWDTVALPRDAKLVAEGRDALRYTARNDGRIFLLDVDENFVVDDRTLLHKEEYVVAPKDNRAWINNQRVFEYDFNERHAYRLYFVERNPDTHDRDNDRKRDAARDAARQDALRKRQTPPPAQTKNEHQQPAGRGVPKNAQIVSSGKNADLAYRATADGNVYLFDADHGVVVEAFTMKRGERLLVSPSRDTAILEGKTVLSRKGLNKQTNYRLFFDPKS